MRTDLRLLYFSLNDKSTKAFHEYLKYSCLDRHYSFRLFNEDEVRFKHASDLIFFLDGQDDPGGVSVIIDYPSFYGDPPSKVPGIDKSFSVKRASEIVRRAILKYPEVLFLFDESWRDKNEKYDFTAFLFDGDMDLGAGVLKEYHQYDVKNVNPFESISRARSNLFDGSNLRDTIKWSLYKHLQVNRRNFSRVQESRSANLALCIEEEHSQVWFNSYALYANGFRVIPISTACELKWVNNITENKENKGRLRPSLIVRDFDLQFPDIDERPSGSKYDLQSKDGSKSPVSIYEIDRIRGAKFFDEASYSSNLTDENKERIPDNYLKKWAIIEEGNEYWNNLKHYALYYITKGGGQYRIISSDSETKKCDQNKQKSDPDKETKTFLSFRDGEEIQELRGLSKPVSGVYFPFHSFKEVLDRYNSFALKKSDCHQPNAGEGDKQGWFIDTGRRLHNHGVPLDIYDLVKSMLERADRYFRNKSFVRAAIVSSEALEILNGSHEAMMLQAYHILAISENAISMNTIGGSEESLYRDASLRVNKIRLEVERMMARNGDKERSLLTFNTLNQIFSDCRNYCKEKEHFQSEDCFIRAMAHINEGYTPVEICEAACRKWRIIKTQLRYLHNYLKNNHENQ